MPLHAPFQSLSIPDLWQQEAVRALREGGDVVVHAPTGAGKTFIFELLQTELKGQAVFTVPTRALANDKRAEWLARGWEVGISTGDVSEGLDRRIVVATLETQRSRLLAGKGPRHLVIDEYQMLSDPVRGVHYELAVALAPPQTQLLLLSGSVANPRDIVSWLERIGRKATLIAHAERPVPLEEVDLQALPDRAPGSVRGWWPRVMTNALLAGLGPVLLFAPRRKSAEHIATQLAAALPPCAPLHLTEEQARLAGGALTRLLKRRVAFHHSGLSFAQRSQVIEPLAKSGQLRVVVATMGLAAGINFSMRSVAISGTTYLAGPFERTVTSAELLQMYGRAGRRGLDDTGYALVTPQPPRLGDAQPLPLKRSNQLDWPTLIAVMLNASTTGAAPFPAALALNERLFCAQRVPLGCEHALASGPAPCSLSVDSERARFLRRGAQEMQGIDGSWEPLSAAVKVPLARAWVQIPPAGKTPEPAAQGAAPSNPRWVPAESVAAEIQKLGSGPVCHLQAQPRRYGREFHVGRRYGDGTLQLAPRLRALLGKAKVPADALVAEVLPRLAEVSGGGVPESLVPRGDQLFAKLSYGAVQVSAHPDAQGRALVAPPTRRIAPAPCEGCAERDWCERAPIADNPAQAWRELGLIEPDGTPTRRGVIFSYFQHGEGLAVAAALEDERYPIGDLIFDLADLRGGPRFADEDSQSTGRLALCCQKTYRQADHPGYLSFGIPHEYGAGAGTAVREIFQHGAGRQQLLTETLRVGDIERALLEWRSLMRHIAHAPDYDWERWRELKRAAAEHSPAAAAAALTR